MLGYPGAGKTTAAEFIAKLTGAVHLASDNIRLELFPNPQFTEEEHQKLYDVIDARTKQLLSEGKDVIYDANLNRYQHRQEKYAICQALGAKPVLLWVQSDKAAAKERATHHSRRKLWSPHETPEAMFDRIAQLIELPQAGEAYIAVDSTKLSENYIQELLTKLQ